MKLDQSAPRREWDVGSAGRNALVQGPRYDKAKYWVLYARTDFALFRDLLCRGLHERGAERWLVFKDDLLQAPGQCIPVKRKTGKNARRPT